MYDLLSKYLAGDISAEEKRILFHQLKEDEELRKVIWKEKTNACVRN